tara:strand:- start:18069 stop:18785 length:717 start_codon:yes stop_codon:yes gene_type:complete
MVTRPVDNSVLEEIIEKSKLSTGMFIHKTHKEILRKLISTFGSLYYMDGNNTPIKIKCFHANPERAISKFFSGKNITLPVLTISETLTAPDEARRRYSPILVHEKYWDSNKTRAIRVLSLSPRPVNITYNINIWTKYKQDMDQIRETIFFLFNPDLEVDTKQSSITKAFINAESEASRVEVPDAEDRLIKKSIAITVETYIPSPKFLYTSTGMIETYNYEVEIENGSDVVTDKETLLN